MGAPANGRNGERQLVPVHSALRRPSELGMVRRWALSTITHLSFGDQLQQNDSVQPKLLMPLVILIGASGSGKTTIARAVQELHSESVDDFFSIGLACLRSNK